MEVERVDFLSIASQDIERARQFYLETLGLPLEYAVEMNRLIQLQMEGSVG